MTTLFGCVLDLLGLIGVIVCYRRAKPYRSLFIATTLHILAGITDFSSIIAYMAGLSKVLTNSGAQAAISRCRKWDQRRSPQARWMVNKLRVFDS